MQVATEIKNFYIHVFSLNCMLSTLHIIKLLTSTLTCMPDFWSLSIGSNKLSNIILSYKEVLMKNEGLTTRKLKCRNQKDKNEMIKI